MRKLAVLFTLLMSLSVAAQRVTNVSAHVDGKKIIITYDLSEDALVDLSVIYNNGLNTSRKETVCLYSHFSSGYHNPNVSGDVGYTKAGKNKTIVWNVLASQEKFIHNDVQFCVNGCSLSHGNKTFLVGTFGYGLTPQYSGGLTFGQAFKHAGYYLSFRSSYLFPTATDNLSCGKNLTINGVYHFYTGQTKKSHVTANVGVVWDMLQLSGTYNHSMCALYMGAGYGQRYQLLETESKAWVTYSPTAYKGFSGEIGIVGAIKGFTLMVGVNTIKFKYMDIVAGLGWTIPHLNK